jgi:5-aminopentanamidase
VLLDSGSLVATYRKAHLWGAEKQAFEPGGRPPPVVRTSAGRVGVMVCYDLEFPEWVRLAAEGGAEVLAVPANWPLRAEGDPQRPFEVVKAQAAAVTYRVNVAVADRCGVERGIDWYGGSLVCDVDGTLLAGPACARGDDGPAGPAVLVAEVDLAAARDKRLGAWNDALADRRPELY